MHALRIGHQGLELLDTGAISLPVTEPARGRLRRVRAGEVPLADVLEAVEELSSRLNVASETADLPPEPDGERIDAFLTSAYRRAWQDARAALTPTKSLDRRTVRMARILGGGCWASAAP